MSTIIILSLVICIIVCIVLSLYLHNFYNNLIDHTNYIIEIGKCDPDVYENYNQLFCMLHPLVVTDKQFRNTVIKKYNLSKTMSALGYLYNGTWKDNPAPDPFLKYMIMNPWYISDDKYNTIENVFYANNLSFFRYNSKIYNNFIEDGLYLSFFYENNNIIRWYIYIDMSIMMEIRKEIVEKSVEIKTANDLEQVLLKKFYKFAKEDFYYYQTCSNNTPEQQDLNVKKCLFFNPDVPSKGINESFSGLVIALKRVIAVALSENVVNEYIEKVDNKIKLGQNLRRIEFFMWLALKSHRDSITFKFKSMPK
jgi:hypothetical protein